MPVVGTKHIKPMVSIEVILTESIQNIHTGDETYKSRTPGCTNLPVYAAAIAHYSVVRYESVRWRASHKA